MSDEVASDSSDGFRTPDPSPSKKALAFSTPYDFVTSQGPFHGYNTAADLKSDLLLELNPCTVMCPESANWVDSVFDQHLITQEKVADAMHVLAKKYDSVQKLWLLDIPRFFDETMLYGPLIEIFSEVFAVNQPADLSSRKAVDTSRVTQEHATVSQELNALGSEKAIKTKPDVLVIGGNHPLLPPGEANPASECSLYNRTIVVGDFKKDAGGFSAANRSQVAMYAR